MTLPGSESRHRMPAAPPRQHADIEWTDSAMPQRLCDLAALLTAAAFALPTRELRAASRRSADVAFARQCAMYLAHVGFGLRYGAIGAGFRRDRTTAARACRLVEERRDDPSVDAVVGALEGICGVFRRRIAGPVQS